MDPTETWRLIREAFDRLRANPDDHEARHEAAELLDLLSQWIAQGGFPPQQ